MYSRLLRLSSSTRRTFHTLSALNMPANHRKVTIIGSGPAGKEIALTFVGPRYDRID
jgi:hypothetical protein